MFDGLSLAAPEWTHAIWLSAFAVALIWWLDTRRRRSLNRLVAPRLASALVQTRGAVSQHLRPALVGLAALAMSVALMRPQFGHEVVQQSRVGAAIMICLDVSRSMLATDAAPNRLERAKAEIRDLLALLKGDQVGLIAFAGRASVLSPLTPDFSFLRLALDDANTASARLGGTNLAEPIDKAIEGFAGITDAARSIILITDGEDHDRFAADAARRAAERGIRILAIGLGNEQGAGITIADPETGAVKPLTDSNGQPVVSRLNGVLLRELALVTDGAYIPAGTGLLDLEAIHTAYIAPLTRADVTTADRIVKRDIYQWAVMVALAALVLAVAAGFKRAPSNAGMLAVLCLGAAWLPADPAMAQPNAPPESPSTDVEQPAELRIPEQARAAYNAGTRALANEQFDRAAKLLNGAVSRAETDDAVRFQALFNLGWVGVRSADSKLASAPSEALADLQMAADYWRRALTLRPAEQTVQANLTIVARRALVLADQLARRAEGTLAQQLQALLASQRALVADLQPLTEADADTPRSVFRAQSVAMLALLPELQSALDRADSELAERAAASPGSVALPPGQASASQDGPAQNELDATALRRISNHLAEAQQRHTQARAQLRKRDATRAFRRASRALSALKRAHAETLALDRRIGALIGEQRALMELTSGIAASTRAFGEAGEGLPAWLSPQYLTDVQTDIRERTETLRSLPRAEPAAEEFAAAQSALSDAEGALAEQALARALAAGQRGLEALALALEKFMQPRQLIELTHATELRIGNALEQLAGHGTADLQGRPAQQSPDRPGERWLGLGVAQARNSERMARLGSALSEAGVAALQAERAAAATTGGTDKPQGTGTASDPAALAAERERLERAYELWTTARNAMFEAGDRLAAQWPVGDEQAVARGPLRDDQTARVLAAANAVDETVSALHELRKLFFNVAEHLKDLAREQADLNDDRGEAAGQAAARTLSDAALATSARTLAARQRELAVRPEPIASALSELAEARAPAPTAGAPGPAAAAAGPDAAAFAEAAGLVRSAGDEMSGAIDHLSSQSAEWSDAATAQDAALKALLEAIARLDQNQQRNNDQQEQRDGDSDSGQQDQTEDTAQATERGNSGLLQGVRDREAARRAGQRARRARASVVARDW
ncbi:MAG: VWA domain-containing protein [Pseudomonadota bacterium]